MDRTQTWNCPIIVLKAPDGIRTASGVEPSVRCCLIEGHQRFRYLAGGLGFEPRLTESESAVLPLNYPPTCNPAFAGFTRAVNIVAARDSKRHAPNIHVGASTSRASATAFQAGKGRRRWRAGSRRPRSRSTGHIDSARGVVN